MLILGIGLLFCLIVGVKLKYKIVISKDVS